MRILFSAPPQTGHLLPALPTLHGLRAAGHDVLLAGYGGNPRAYDITGLPVVEVGDGMTVDQAYAALPTGSRFETAAVLDGEAIFRRPAAANAILLRPTITPLLDVVRRWRPDVLVYDPFQGAVPLVAAITGLPAVEHQFGPINGRSLSGLLAGELADVYREHGLDGPERAVSIEIVPPSLHAPDPDSWQTRYVPLHGPATMPHDLLTPGDRPRVLVSFGTIVRADERDRRLGTLLPLLADTDADFLLPGADLGTLPANVRPLPWIPVTEVLRHCRAVIHHGGAGTLMAAVTSATPQLIVPHHGDQPYNADVVTKAAVGLTAPTTTDIDAALLATLLHDDSLLHNASALRDENARQPAPATLAERFEWLCA
ncbi:glycosyltransferase [Catenuloplanes sp. NPDC051500]|uniref:glycosyltransferase n=1 Tax=Catenuloplanes sp. NPDC051500 TaxID=3363959 RepID=UPI0037877D28